MLTITLKEIDNNAYPLFNMRQMKKAFSKTHADDDPIAFSDIEKRLGFYEALYCMQALPEKYQPAIALLACDFAERALRFVPEGEDRPRIAIDTTRRWVRGEATIGQVWEAESRAFYCAESFDDNSMDAEDNGDAAAAMTAYAAGFAAKAARAAARTPTRIVRAAEAARNAAIWEGEEAMESENMESETAWQLARFLEWLDQFA